MLKDSKLTVVLGHYGCGKTNFSINLAVNLQKKYGDAVIVDLDLVNPYFRSSDFCGVLDRYGIKLIAPVYAHTNLDIPSLPPEIYSIFDSEKGHVVIDVGGDDVGATALGRFARRINAADDLQVLYVINKFRPLSEKSDDCAELLAEIEQASRIKATGIINNSHLMGLTTAADIEGSQEYAETVAQKTGLALAATAVRRDLADKVNLKGDIYPIEIFVGTPWD
ncbi:MAG: ParA family protein [Clostridia bacterium]|nr:ParA family protein [Clostridia bacterium]